MCFLVLLATSWLDGGNGCQEIWPVVDIGEWASCLSKGEDEKNAKPWFETDDVIALLLSDKWTRCSVLKDERRANPLVWRGTFFSESLVHQKKMTPPPLASL
jgi:hypothetical protein